MPEKLSPGRPQQIAARPIEDRPHLAAKLHSGCSGLALVPNAQQQQQLLRYVALLERWNKAYNLTAVRDPVEMITRHILDSLVVAPFVSGKRNLDVGSGAGLPGVPLAILLPKQTFHLVDSNGKKARFLFQVKTELCLDNMVVHHTRVESLPMKEPFDAVLSRAFASLADFVRGTRALVASGGRLLALKGVYPTQELAAVAPLCDSAEVHTLRVPGLSEQRHLVEMAVVQRAPTGAADESLQT